MTGSAQTHTIGGLLAEGRGVKGKCRDCGRERTFSFAALTALPLPRLATLGEAGAMLKCRECDCRQILLTPADIDPRAPLPAAKPATAGAAL